HFVRDVSPSRGPLSGLTASLDRIRTSHLLALAIDMPFMTQKYLKFLCHQIKPGCGVLPKIGSRAEPLSAIYPREASPDFRRALAGADFSLQTLTSRLIDAGKLRPIAVLDEEKNFFVNLNEPADVQSGWDLLECGGGWVITAHAVDAAA